MLLGCDLLSMQVHLGYQLIFTILTLDENLNFLIQDKCSIAGVSCTFHKTHHTSCSQDRAKFHLRFPAHVLKFLRTGVAKVQKSVQEILLYPICWPCYMSGFMNTSKSTEEKIDTMAVIL